MRLITGFRLVRESSVSAVNITASTSAHRARDVLHDRRAPAIRLQVVHGRDELARAEVAAGARPQPSVQSAGDEAVEAGGALGVLDEVAEVAAGQRPSRSVQPSRFSMRQARALLARRSAFCSASNIAGT